MDATIDGMGFARGRGTGGGATPLGLCGKANPRASTPVGTRRPPRGAEPVGTLDGTRGASVLVRVARAVRGTRATIGALAGRDGDLGRRRSLVLGVVQPALTGLIDGTISTIAPLFATAFATHDDHAALLVGLASAVGAGVSMGFAEGLSDDGVVSGRGSPRTRGVVCGLATALGGLGHALPFLARDFRVATGVAAIVVALELWLIAWVRARFMDTPMGKAMVQVVLGGAVALAIGIVVGSS